MINSVILKYFTSGSNEPVIGQQEMIMKECIMLLLLTRIIGLLIGLFLVVAGVTSAILHPTPIHWSTSGIVLIVLFLLLMVLGFLRSIHFSKIKVGAINRAEFYGVVVAMVGVLMYMNTRIDQIYQIILNLPD
jgi:hypothetical protein